MPDRRPGPTGPAAILTVTPNPAVDLTYRVPALLPGASHRVAAVRRRVGGKGVNVARMLHAGGHPVVLTGFAGGRPGPDIGAELAGAGLDCRFVPVAGATRRTVTVVDPSGATVFNEPGPPVGPADWSALADRVRDLLDAVGAVVCSGSLPPGSPPDGYARLVGIARSRGIPAVVDAGGESLLRAAEAGADLLKPNAEELAAGTGHPDPAVGAAALLRRGAGAVVVSLGPDGLLAVTPNNAWRAVPPERVTGNPTGAGDAAVAALAAGLVAGQPWPERLRDAVAWSAAAVCSPVAGEADRDAYLRFRPHVVVAQTARPETVEETHAPGTDR